MSSTADDAAARLEELLRSNSIETAPTGMLSEEEKKIQALMAANTVGGVAEDFVALDLPGFDGSSTSGVSSREAVSPMLSVMTGMSSGGGPRGGAFGTDSNTGKKFNVIKIKKGDGVCLADIGDGAKFCLKVRCTTASHLNANAFKLDGEGVIAIAKSRDAAFAMPVVGGGVLPQSVWDEWVANPRSLSDWQDMFKAATQDDDFASEADFQSKLLQQQRSDLFKTPSKKQTLPSSNLSTTLQDFALYLPSITGSKKDAFQRTNPGRMAELVLELDDSLGHLSAKFVAFVKETQDALSSLGLSDSMLELKSDSVSSLVGSIKVMGGSVFQNPTAFGTMAALSAKITEMDLAGPPLIDFSPIQSQVEAAKAEAKKVQNLLIALVTTLSNKIGILESTNRRNGNGPNPVTFAAVAPPLPSPLVSGNQSGAPFLVARDLADLLARVQCLESERSRLDLEIQRLVSEGDDTAIKFAGLGLKTLAETASWVNINTSGGILPFGLIPDVYFILDIVAADGVTSQSNMLQTLNRLKNLDLDSEYEAKAIAAFLLEVPRFFHGASESGSFASGSGESQLSMLPSFKSWSVGQSSRKKLLERKLPNIRSSFRSLIANSLQMSNPRFHAIAIEALDRSITWIISFGSWIDRAYEYAHVGSKLSESKAWALVTQLARRVFAEIFVVRMGTAQAMTGDRASICSSILWSVFRTHDKMTEFEDANFEDHPAVSSEYIKFLATNSGFDLIVDLEKEVASLKSEAKDSERKMNAVIKKADSASTSADSNKRLIAEMSKRVDKKQDK